jgi:hypothetical protein
MHMCLCHRSAGLVRAPHLLPLPDEEDCMSKRRAPPRPPAGGSEPPHDAAELRHLAACAWNFALTDRYRRTRDWRLFSFRREVERRRPLPFWYQANEDDLRRRGGAYDAKLRIRLRSESCGGAETRRRWRCRRRCDPSRNCRTSRRWKKRLSGYAKEE